MDRYICIHGHFYQPPRENPWLEIIEVQDSAYPFHDWNERITDECYAPNGASRVLDGEGRILEIVNNYSRISFNFGPTLLAWMEQAEPETYQMIIEADRLSQERYSGHGSAIAQVYNHMIMPLANRRDKETQVIWGIADFEHRFGRKPEGMWLAETAVDNETLDILATHGIAFTILAPHQAARFREIGKKEEWTDVSGGHIDPTRPYLVNLDSGRSITVFFYDGPISQAVAFEGLLESGERLANRLVDAFSEDRDWPQIVHIAADGETYGHHHPHGEMALSYALRHIDEEDLAIITNYGEYLELHPPAYEAEIIENTSWSCIHGVERWRANCGCNTDGRPEWTQAWRAPLRDALDFLRDRLESIYLEKASEYFADPWAARDAYISVVVDRSTENVDRFIQEQARRNLTEDEVVTLLELMELQRHAMLMYTSCGWFFDELSGIETIQVMQYAGRAVQLADQLNGEGIESDFIERLALAESNLPHMGNGATIYDKFVRPASIDLPKVAAHYAMKMLFEEEPSTSVYSFDALPIRFERFASGRASLGIGQVDLISRVTRERGKFAFGVVHLGDHSLDGGVRPYESEECYEQMAAQVTQAFRRADFPETIRLIDRHFGDHAYSLGSLFRDEQRRITEIILNDTLGEVVAVYRHIYEDHAPLMRFLDSIDVPLPRAFRTTAELIMNVDIRQAAEQDDIDLDYIRNYFEETKDWGLELDVPGLSFTLSNTIERLSGRLCEDDASPELLEHLTEAIELAHWLPFTIDLWDAQNDFYRVLQDRYPIMRQRAARGDREARTWIDAFQKLGEALSVRIET